MPLETSRSRFLSYWSYKNNVIRWICRGNAKKASSAVITPFHGHSVGPGRIIGSTGCGSLELWKQGWCRDWLQGLTPCKSPSTSITLPTPHHSTHLHLLWAPKPLHLRAYKDSYLPRFPCHDAKADSQSGRPLVGIVLASHPTSSPNLLQAQSWPQQQWQCLGMQPSLVGLPFLTFFSSGVTLKASPIPSSLPANDSCPGGGSW